MTINFFVRLQLLQGNVSECRNKSLQTMFTMIGASEKAGSGVDKIRAGWSSQHWRSPLVREQLQPDRVLWVLPMISLIPAESLERLKKLFGKGFSQFSAMEVQALVTADIEGYVDSDLVHRNHEGLLTRFLTPMVAHGRLELLYPDKPNRTDQAYRTAMCTTPPLQDLFCSA